MKTSKEIVVEALQEKLTPYLGEGITDNVLKIIGITIKDTLQSFVDEGTLDKEYWAIDNTIITCVSEMDFHKVDILLPGWLYDWLEDEEDKDLFSIS